MGFVQRNNPSSPLDMTKAVVSIWFNIPPEAWAAAAADYAANSNLGDPDVRGVNSVMVGVIPLVTWGRQQTDKYYQSEVIVACEHDFPVADAPPIHKETPGKVVSGSNTTPSQPSFIGIMGGGPNAGSLVVHIQTANKCSGSNMLMYLTSCAYNLEPPMTPEAFYDFTDVSYIIGGANDYFGNSQQWFGRDGIPDGQQHPSIGSGSVAWHNATVSWDVTPGSAVHSSADSGDTIEQLTTAYSMLWCALDDVNKDGVDLPALWLGMFGTNTTVDANAMLCSKCFSYPNNNNSEDDGTLTLTVTSVPSNPISIPGPGTIHRDSGSIEPVRKVRIDKLQIFTGVTMDTGVEANRRAFINADGTPADPALAQSLLGKAPEVLLSSFKNWETGKNLGTAGPFTKTGTLSSYAGSPKLGA